MKGTPAFRCLFIAACMVGCSTTPVPAAESPSFTAYSQGQYMMARKLAEREAAQGSKEAYTLLGEIYQEGLGVAQDYKKAADAYRKGAELGDAPDQRIETLDPNSAQVSRELVLRRGLDRNAELGVAQ